MDFFGFFEIPTTLALFLLAFGLYVYHMSSTHGTFRKMGIPGPMPLPIVGNSVYTVKTGVFQCVVNGYRHFKKKGYSMYGLYEGRTPILNILDLDMIEDVMVKQFQDFPNRRKYASMDQRVLKNIMFNLDNEEWKAHRALLKPALSPARLKAGYPRLQKTLNNLLDAMQESARAGGNELELSDLIGRYCMDVVAGVGFDFDANSIRNPGNDFLAGARKFMEEFDIRTLLFEFLAPPSFKKIMDRFDISIIPKEMVYFLQEFTRTSIKKRKEGDASRSKNDLFQYFVDNSIFRDENKEGRKPSKPFNEEEMYAISIALFIAGYDTLAKGVYYGIYILANHPEYFNKAQQEIDEVLKGEFPNPDNVKKLTYMNRCLKEGLRILPIGQFTERITARDTYLRGHFVPKGMIVRVPLAGLLRDEKFFPNPDEYDPDNFLPERIAGRPKMAYMPFGNGPRGCFGYSLAMLLLQTGVAAFIQRFNMKPCAKTVYPVRLSRISDLVPDHPLILNVTPRK